MKKSKREALGTSRRVYTQKKEDEGRALVTDLAPYSLEETGEVLDKADNARVSKSFFLRGFRQDYIDFLWSVTPKGKTLGYTVNILVGRIKAAHEQKCLREDK